MIDGTGGNAMSLPSAPATSDLSALLRGVVADLQRASHADMVSLFLYDEESSHYYAPFAVGQPEDSLLDSLADVHGQLNRYRADRSQGKVPDELRVPHYGSTVWLTVTRQTLVARDAPTEIDSTFVRRHRVRSTIGLPLLVGEHVLGLVYLNYCDPPNGPSEATAARVPDDDALVKLQRRAADAAFAIQVALTKAERRALDGVRRLSAQLTAPVEDAGGDPGAVR